MPSKRNKKRRTRKRQQFSEEQSLTRQTQSTENTNLSQVTLYQVPPEIPPPRDSMTEFSNPSLARSLIRDSSGSDSSTCTRNEMNCILREDEEENDIDLPLEPTSRQNNNDADGTFTGSSKAKLNRKDNINWKDPTISGENLDMIGRPCPKPSISTQSSSITFENVEENRRKVAYNVRRKKMVIWILTFAFALVWTSYADIFKRMSDENDEIFSMAIMKPWMMPGLITEFSITGLAFGTIMLKMTLLQDKCVGCFHRVIMAFNNLQYILAMLVLPVGVYFFFMQLTTDMKAELKGNLTLVEEASLNWNVTQQEHQCCGYQNRFDWTKNMSKIVDIHLMDMLAEGDADILPVPTVRKYPLSCCNVTAFGNVSLSDLICTETSKNFWTRGCYNKEFIVILDYAVCTAALIFISLVLSIMIRLCVDKLERYMTIFRPREMF